MPASTKAYRRVFRRPGEPRTRAFPRSSRLKSRRLIQSLFDRARADSLMLTSGAIRILYRWIPITGSESASPVQIGFAIGRSAGNAVRRNRIKRLLREEYRFSRTQIENALNRTDKRVVLMVVLRNNQPDPDELKKAFRNALLQLTQRESVAVTGEGRSLELTTGKTEQPQ